MRELKRVVQTLECSQAKKQIHSISLSMSFIVALTLFSSSQISAAPKDLEINCHFIPSLTCLDNEKILWTNPHFTGDAEFVRHKEQLYVSQHSRVSSLNINTGQTVWEIKANSGVRFFKPSLSNKSIYLARSDGSLESRQLISGKLNWSKNISNGWIYPPVIIDNKLITGGQAHAIWIIDASNGDLLREHKTSQELVMPLFDGGDYFVSSHFDRTLQAYSKNGLAPIWQTQLGAPIFEIFQTNGMLIASDMAGDVIAINAKTGQTIWQEKLHKNAQYKTVLQDHKIFSSNISGESYLLDLYTGNRLFTSIKNENKT